MNKLNMRTQILCHRNEKKINQKFVWLKVALVNIAFCTVHDNPPFPMEPILFVMEQYERFFKPKWITL
jgi:hypothetical protein